MSCCFGPLMVMSYCFGLLMLMSCCFSEGLGFRARRKRQKYLPVLMNLQSQIWNSFTVPPRIQLVIFYQLNKTICFDLLATV